MSNCRTESLLPCKASLDDMLAANQRCTLHSGDLTCQCSYVGNGPGAEEISMLVTGSPCNPFSTKRNKRFHDGSVVAHPMSRTTMRSVVLTYTKYEPRVGITEQVRGFGMRYSAHEEATPLSEFLGFFNSKFQMMNMFFQPCYYYLLLMVSMRISTRMDRPYYTILYSSKYKYHKWKTT